MPAVKSEKVTSIERLPLTSNDKENFVDTVRHFAQVCMGMYTVARSFQGSLGAGEVKVKRDLFSKGVHGAENWTFILQIRKIVFCIEKLLIFLAFYPKRDGLRSIHSER